MQIRIEYCVVWNYEPRAAGLAADLEKEFGAETKLISGGRGDFEVYLEKTLLFSKKKLDRFPEVGEVNGLILEQVWSYFCNSRSD